MDSEVNELNRRYIERESLHASQVAQMERDASDLATRVNDDKKATESRHHAELMARIDEMERQDQRHRN